MMNDKVYPNFAIDAKSHQIIITEGVYNNTSFKIKRIRIEDETLKYDVEFNELWLEGGQVENAHSDELQEFINIEALSVVKRLIEMSSLIKNT
jgi:hypothetical protein